MKKILLLISVFCIFSFRMTAESWGLVCVSVTDMKTSHDYSSETISQALMGTPVKVGEKVSYWYHITTPEGYQGWTTEKNIVLSDDRRMSQWKNAARLIVTDYFAVVRENADETSQVISDCVMGNILEHIIEESDSEYTAVQLPDGRRGYVEAGKVVPLDEYLSSKMEISGKDIVSTAMGFQGFVYLWGGLSPKGLDCSGLVKLTYFMNGIVLLRDARQQIATGEAVDYNDLSNLQAGDLVFFGRKDENGRPVSVTHVGIYMSEGEMVHSSLVVRVNSLVPGKDNSYTSKKLVGATRILGSQGVDKDIVRVSEHPWYY